jgi:hypothetical protein
MVTRRIKLLSIPAVLLIVAAFVCLRFLWPWGRTTESTSARQQATTEEHEANLPRINLARLDVRGDESRTVSRDVFEYGRPPAPPIPEAPPEELAAPQPFVTPVLPMEATPLPLPPLNVRFIGAVKTPRGEWFAALLTEGKELLTGKEGDVLASRFEIVKIGHESLDVREVASGSQRRIRLGGR